MRAKVKKVPTELVLTRTLDAFAQELIDVSDEEILEVAKHLGMDVTSRNSAAFAGVTYPARWQLADFFDLEELQKAQLATDRVADNLPARPKNGADRSKGLQSSSRRKPSGGK